MTYARSICRFLAQLAPKIWPRRISTTEESSVWIRIAKATCSIVCAVFRTCSAQVQRSLGKKSGAATFSVAARPPCIPGHDQVDTIPTPPLGQRRRELLGLGAKRLDCSFFQSLPAQRAVDRGTTESSSTSRSLIAILGLGISFFGFSCALTPVQPVQVELTVAGVGVLKYSHSSPHEPP